MTKRKFAPNRAALLLPLLCCVGFCVLAIWHFRSGHRHRHSLNSSIVREQTRDECQLRQSVSHAIAAVGSIAAVDSLEAPPRTDDHKTEHLRPKDANEMAISELYASLSTSLTSWWEAALLPLLDAGCTSITVNSIRHQPTTDPAAVSAASAADSTAAAAAYQHSSSSSSNDRKGQQKRRAKRTAMLLVSDQRSRLQLHLQSYSVQLATLWYYAHSQNYALELYTHNDTLPANVTGHFVKIQGVKTMFALGYDYVLGLDWDMYISPYTAVPLSVFFSEWPRASILVQGEDNMCTGAVLYRNTHAAVRFLQHWWELALTGCCWRGPLHDQVSTWAVRYCRPPAVYWQYTCVRYGMCAVQNLAGESAAPHMTRSACVSYIKRRLLFVMI